MAPKAIDSQLKIVEWEGTTAMAIFKHKFQNMLWGRDCWWY